MIRAVIASTPVPKHNWTLEKTIGRVRKVIAGVVHYVRPKPKYRA